MLANNNFSDAPHKPVPVLLVHGIFDSSAQMGPLKSRLETAGAGKILAIDLKPNDGSASILTLAKQVDDAVTQLRTETGSDKIDVVGFSMGAFTSRVWMTRYDGYQYVRRFVSISGPQHGTVFGTVFPGPGPRDMSQRSNLLDETEATERWRRRQWGTAWPNTTVYSVWTPMDLIIIPAHSSRIEDAIENVTFPVVLHPLMLVDDRVLSYVTRTLSAP